MTENATGPNTCEKARCQEDFKTGVDAPLYEMFLWKIKEKLIMITIFFSESGQQG